MRVQNTYSVSNTILFFLISVLAFFVSSCQQSDYNAITAQNEALAMDYIEAFYPGDFDIIEGLLADTDAEPYLPEGFEAYLPEEAVPGNVGPSGELILLAVWSIECEPVHENEEPLNMVWMDFLVDPPEAYRSDDVDTYTVPVQLFTSSPTLVETLHSFGIPQAEPSDVTLEVNEQADMERTGLADAAGGGEEVTMETHVAGSPAPDGDDGLGWRMFGIEDGQVTGVVDVVSSDYDIMPGQASLTENTFFSEQIPESIYSVHAWEIDFHLEPVEYR